MIEKLKIGPTRIPTKKNKCSQEHDVAHDEPNGDTESGDIPYDATKVVNEGPQVVVEVQDKGSTIVDDMGIYTSSRNFDSTATPKVPTTRHGDSAASPKFPTGDKHGRSFDDPNYPYDPNMPPLENIYYDTDDEALDGKMFGAEADINNMELNIPVSPTQTTRVHKIHPKEQILGDPSQLFKQEG